MTRRRLLCGLLFASGLLACFAGVLLIPDDPQVTVTRWRFGQVTVGMSRQEVIRTIGGPPGDYSRDMVFPLAHPIRRQDYQSWVCDEAELLVRFDADRATETLILAVYNSGRPPTLTEKIRRWLGL
jgi:hypothetical protein